MIKQLELGMSEATKIMQKRIERGKSNSEEMGKVLTAITPTLSYENISQAELIMEAVVENEEVKKEVLSHIEDFVKDDAILTSNTSTISITKLAENLKRPENKMPESSRLFQRRNKKIQQTIWVKIIGWMMKVVLQKCNFKKQLSTQLN